MVGFFNYDRISMEGAIVAEAPLSRRFIKMCFSYVFDQMDCRRFFVRVQDTNPKALELDKRLGFVPEGTLREAGLDGSDVHILGMLKHECRWLNGR